MTEHALGQGEPQPIGFDSSDPVVKQMAREDTLPGHNYQFTLFAERGSGDRRSQLGAEKHKCQSQKHGRRDKHLKHMFRNHPF